MNDYLTKPINVDTLLTVLQKWAKPTKSIAKVNNNSDMPEVAAPTTAFTQPMQPLPAHLPGIDMADAMVRMQGNIALLHKLIIVFTDSCADVVSTLSTSIDSNDTIAAKQIAHRLKGSAANISATELSALAKAIENALSLNDTDAIAPLMQKLPGLSHNYATLQRY